MSDAPRGRWFAIVLAAGAIALIVAAALSSRWLVTGTGTGFGLRTYEACHALGCDAKPIDALPPDLIPPALVRAGLLTTIASWIGAGGLALALLPMLAGIRSGLARAADRLGLLALVVALGGAVWFVLSRPGTSGGVSGYELGIGFWLFAGGNVLGLTAGQMLAKLHAPVDPS